MHRAMALIEICCPHCFHSGYIPTGALGRVLRCAACGRARLVRRGKQLICLRDENNDASPATARAVINDAPAEGNLDALAQVDEEARWQAYENPPGKPKPSPAPPSRRPGRPKKRRLTPRVPETV
jgi:hypothetical protein